MFLSGCGAPTHSDLVGSWVMTDDSRSHLGHGHRLTLYAFADDPDQGNRIEFEKVDWNAER